MYNINVTLRNVAALLLQHVLAACRKCSTCVIDLYNRLGMPTLNCHATGLLKHTFLLYFQLLHKFIL